MKRKAAGAFSRFFRRLRDEFAECRQEAMLPSVRFAGSAIVRGAERITAGRNVFVDFGAYLNPSTVNERRGFINIGDDVEIGPYSVLWGGGGLTIGNNVHLGAHVHITTQAGIPVMPDDPDPVPIAVDVAPVVIEDHVMVYSGAIIVPGVRIGAYSIVGAGAVVTRDVPPHSRVAGVPATPLANRRRWRRRESVATGR